MPNSTDLVAAHAALTETYDKIVTDSCARDLLAHRAKPEEIVSFLRRHATENPLPTSSVSAQVEQAE